MDIRQIKKEEAWTIRHIAMWPGQSIDYIKLKEDETGIHFGLLDEGELRSVVSLFIKKEEAQFRKFATLPSHQGKGYGTYLLNHVLHSVEKQGVKRIWCNARQTKASFYKKFGLIQTEQTFQKGKITYIIMERFFN
ncbi:GNAT family N-acetyltransferase [Priestia megaterium]|nr:GNAT family N-acetyltransferase [Priestia megaterium]